MDNVRQQPRFLRIISSESFTSLPSLVGLIPTLLVCLEEIKV